MSSEIVVFLLLNVNTRPTPALFGYPMCTPTMNHRPLRQMQEVEGDIRRILEKISVRTNPAFIAEFGDDTLWPIQT